MTNDTNTLNGALMELGELMASNLNIMGVDDAIPQDGLTTLANKILNIQSININIMSFVVNGDINIQDFNPIYNGDNLVILWGDQSYSRYIDGALQYTYDDERNEHIVYIIGDITELGDNCFNACTNITSISIPDSVTSFGSACFNGCTSLVDIDIPNSLISFGNNCFASCANLTEIIIPDTISTLPDNCFNNCISLTNINIPDSITNIGSFAFYECSRLISVTIPSSVISIGSNCFANCPALIDYQLYWINDDIITYNSNIMFTNNDTIFTIPQGETNNYIEKQYPIDKLVERIPHYNYDINISKKYIIRDETTVINITVTDDNDDPVIGESIDIDIGGVISTDITDNNGQINVIYTGLGIIGKVIVNCESETDVFYDGGVLVKRSVEEITLGDGDGSTPWLVSNGDVVIDWGDGIRNTVNNPTTSLSHTYSQSNSDYITLIGDITHLGNSCFNYCESIEKVTIPASVISIDDYCFYSCYSLQDIIFSDNITSIGDQCFRYCSNIKDIIIPDGVTEIGDYCFNNCSGLESVSIPSSVTSIGDYCFDSCPSLENYELYWTYPDIYLYDIDKMPTETFTIFTIPYGEIENYITAGYPAGKLREREAPPMVILEYTGDNITIGYNSSWLPSVGDVLVDWGDGNTDIVNNPTTALEHTYTDGVNNHTIKLIGDITSLGGRCFYNCTGLTSVVIPDSVNSLGGQCFYSTSLTSIIIPDTVTNLGTGCFSGCTGLTSVVIPDSVNSLGNACFYNCTGLTSVTIPDSITSLGSSCFSGCTSLVDYQLYWTGNNIIPYDSNKMPNNTNTVFTIPTGETSNYIAKGYSSAKLQERNTHNYVLSISCDTPIIEGGNSASVVATLTDNGVAVSGESVVFKNGSTVLDTVTTDSNGQATYIYTGTGAGDITFTVESMSLQETYGIEDCYVMNFSASHSFGSADEKYKVFEIPVWDSYEIEGKLKCNINNRFSVGLKLDNNNTSNAMVRIGAYTALESAIFNTNGGTIVREVSGNYIANTDINFKFVYSQGNVKLYINNAIQTEGNIDYYPTYLMLHSYSSSKTVSLSDVKIKAL